VIFQVITLYAYGRNDSCKIKFIGLFSYDVLAKYKNYDYNEIETGSKGVFYELNYRVYPQQGSSQMLSIGLKYQLNKRFDLDFLTGYSEAYQKVNMFGYEYQNGFAYYHFEGKVEIQRKYKNLCHSIGLTTNFKTSIGDFRFSNWVFLRNNLKTIYEEKKTTTTNLMFYYSKTYSSFFGDIGSSHVIFYDPKIFKYPHLEPGVGINLTYPNTYKGSIDLSFNLKIIL
jgi:hypothetical protein